MRMEGLLLPLRRLSYRTRPTSPSDACGLDGFYLLFFSTKPLVFFTEVEGALVPFRRPRKTFFRKVKVFTYHIRINLFHSDERLSFLTFFFS